MANLQEVRTRIASVSSTQQITSAMKLVSAAKFRRAQTAIIGMRPYADKLGDIVSKVGTDDGVSTPYHTPRRVASVLLVVVTSNKGLCGAFNANVIKMATAKIQEYQQQGVSVKVMTLGKRGTEHFSKQKEVWVASHDELLDEASFDNVCRLADEVIEQYLTKKYDKVEILYNLFKNSLVQVLTDEQFLPIVSETATNTSHKEEENVVGEPVHDYIFEPSKVEILEEMTPIMLRSRFYRIILDSLASEHGARMNAMQKATDNATELLKELRLTYNKARQAAITNEIIEIVSGAEALNG